MDGFVDDSRGGVTELRVHGVSGTPPDSMLENPHVTRVSGDSTAGFYRRIWLGGPPSPSLAYTDIRDERRREAYSWGGLTSGAGSRALWMLLLPFMLANVAFWMYPAATLPDEEPRWRSRARDFAAALQRLFSLSLTVALTLSVVDVATDFAGWQCGGSRACVAQNSFLHFLTLSFFSQPGHRLALATVVPVAVVVLLWVLGQQVMERVRAAVATRASAVTGRGPFTHAGDRAAPDVEWRGAGPADAFAACLRRIRHCRPVPDGAFDVRIARRRGRDDPLALMFVGAGRPGAGAAGARAVEAAGPGWVTGRPTRAAAVPGSA